MIHILSTLKMQGSISSLKVIEDKLYALDNKYNISVFSDSTFKTNNKLVLINDSDERHVYDKSYTISTKLHFYASKANSTCGYLSSLDGTELSEKNELCFHTSAVSYSSFSHDSNLLAIGGEDGIVYFYDIDISKTTLSFPPRADAISSISFSQNDKFTCIGSYDKSIKIYNIQSNKEIANISLSDVPEDSIFLCEMIKVAGITRDKKLFLYDYKDNSLKYLDFLFDEWPTSIERVGLNHLVVSTRGDILYLIKIDDELEVVKQIKLEHIGVKKLYMHNKKLYIGYISGEIDIIDTTYLSDEFEQNLQLTNYEIATSLMEKNIFLLTCESVKHYDKAWEQVLDVSKEYLLAKNIDESMKIVKPFFFDKKKVQEYNFINVNKENILHFTNLVNSNKDILAFQFADKHTYLKDMKEYNVIEEKWQKVYQVCKMMFEKDDPVTTNKAKQTLQKYAAIPSKKESINNLILNYKDFIKVFKLIKARNFRLYFILVEKKPFLAQEDLYEKVNKIGNQTYTKLIGLEQNEEFEKATSLANSLKDFTDFKAKVIDTTKRIDEKIKLQNSIEKNDLVTVYNAVHSNPILEDLLAFNEYHKEFETARQHSLNSAKEGNTPLVYNILEKYLKIDYLIDNIATIFKLSYISEMENEAKSDFMSIDWEKTIDRYITLFSLDNELSNFLKTNAQEYQMAVKSGSNEDIKGYLKNDFYDAIVVHKE